jgi:formylglycine-generating enzyme required for sulfatase activity
MLLKIPEADIQKHIFQVETPSGELFSIPMIFVEGGTFEMGGESWRNDAKPIHPVKLDDYYIGQYLVTQDLWQAVMGENPSYFQGNTRPVENISWNDCQEFLEKLNQLIIKDLEGKPLSGGKFRLPSEAEWEYAARGGKHWQDKYEYAGSNDLAQVAWYEGNSFAQTMPVGLKLPNQLGIYDLSGNIWEWCEDKYDSDFYAECKSQGIVSNPICRAENTTYRVSRGGSYFSFAEDCRVSTRSLDDAEIRGNNLGFRVGFSFQFS